MNYSIAAELPADVAAELKSYHPVLQQLLFRRGITSVADANSFLKPDFATTHDAMLMPGMAVAIKRILEAIKNKEVIGIFSDYDCDGIPGAVIVHDFLRAIAYEHFTVYIPHRHYEGFGFSERAVEKLKEENVSLIITIDCGTTNHEAVNKATEMGIDVIITDHHEPRLHASGEFDLPAAVAVVNPRAGDTYPFPHICGAAVVYKLVEALIAEGKKTGLFTLAPGWEKWWLDMVGIATIADMVPLTGENRILAHYGLTVLRKSRRPGLQQLLRKQRVEQRYLSEDDIGFTIGPRINAASRMDTPEDAFHLLATTDEGDAGARVNHLEKLNNERRGQVATMTKEIHKRLKDQIEIPPVLVLGNPDWRPALVGLAANKLAEEHARPVFLWGRDGNGSFKGSCRSDGQVSVVRLMEGIADHFVEHGGHHQSGGFTVHPDSIHTFSESINAVFTKLGDTVLINEVPEADMSLSIDAIDRAVLSAQQLMAPFGMSNPKPLYEVTGIVPKSVEVFGKTREHTKLTFETKGIVREAIAFFRLPETFHSLPTVGNSLIMLAHLEESFFMGRRQTRLRIVDIV